MVGYYFSIIEHIAEGLIEGLAHLNDKESVEHTMSTPDLECSGSAIDSHDNRPTCRAIVSREELGWLIGTIETRRRI